MAHVAESTHWYDKSGLPAYEVASKDGSMRPTTLRDARKHGYVPSVTTIIRSASAPALERWKIQQGIMAALTLTREPDESDEAFLARVMRDSQEQGKQAAERGTEIHAAIQGYYEGLLPPDEMHPFVKGVKDQVSGVFGEQDWKAEASFSHPIGFGGKVDLHCPAFVIDFKGKDFGPDDKLEAYDEHAMQLAAYRHGLNLPTASAGIVYCSRNNPGLARVCPVSQEALERGWSMFMALFAYWCAKNKYAP